MNEYEYWISISASFYYQVPTSVQQNCQNSEVKTHKLTEGVSALTVLWNTDIQSDLLSIPRHSHLISSLQGVFTVWEETPEVKKTTRGHQRQVFLFKECIVLCKLKRDTGMNSDTYTFKNKMKVGCVLLSHYNDNINNLKGPMLYLFSDLYYPPQTPVGKPCTIIYPTNYT